MGDPLDNEIAELRHTLDAALRRYKEAKHATQKVVDMRAQQLLPSPDGTFALNEALQRETTALREYRYCLMRFAEVWACFSGWPGGGSSNRSTSPSLDFCLW